MAKVEYAYPVESLHGKVSKSHAVGFARMTQTGTKFTQTYGKRTSEPTQTELDHRELFKTVCAATRARLQDPQHMAPDVVAWRNQTRYKTLYGYVFGQEWDAAAKAGK